MKKLSALLLIFTMMLGFCACDLENTSSTSSASNSDKQLSKFYDAVHESTELLNSVADDIYQNWYDAIYNDKFREDINVAIASAQSKHTDDITKIEELDKEIATYFGKVKNGENAELVKDVMSAYSDYYEFVINVSGSFKSYSESIESLKKELTSCLRELSYEID